MGTEPATEKELEKHAKWDKNVHGNIINDVNDIKKRLKKIEEKLGIS